MVDRIITYVGEVPLCDDFLNAQKNGMIALGMALQAILGTSTVVNGLACTPTGPASMNVLIGPGSIYAQENVDNTAYGDINADTAHQIVKQGISLGTTSLALTAPSTTGYSINYLVQVEYEDVDTGSTVLPYFNASNPAVAYAGPANTGVSQNTIRQGQCVISLKAGSAATTGSQVTPTPDAGFIGLWVITVANGATSITSGNIALYTGSASATGSTAFWSTPFLSETLQNKVSIATGDLRWAPLSGANARTKLSNNTTYYVSTSGNDSTGNGSSGTPWATLQHAINSIANNVDLQGFTATINGNGNTYTVGGTVSQPWVGGAALDVVISDFTINASSGNCLSATGTGSGFSVNNVTLTNSASAGACIAVTDCAQVGMGAGISFGNTSSGTHLFVANDASLAVNNSYSYSGNFTNHIQMLTNGSLVYGPSLAMTGSGSMAFTTFCSMTGNCSIFFNTGCSFSGGTPTGTNYVIGLNSTVNSSGVGTGIFPGTGGTTPTGGQIV